ncbi:MAG: betaine-aldehyde dehydrogenase [Ilumatobacter sp.]|nr:betaine-aldehyde dehydrogenase [Ilumatobacter sp.]
MEVQRLHIDGGYVDATSGETFTTVNPATNRDICEVQQAAEADVDRAVDAARRGFEVWSQMPAMDRTRIMLRAVEILRDRNDEFAHLETLDTGKPLSETTTEDIRTGADVIEFYAGLISSLHGQHFDFPPAAFATIRREPLGVCAGIGAWNYPMQIAMWKSAPALACGNSFIFKPAELTPLTALRLAEVYTEAGVPDGVFNVVQGDHRVGQMLSRHQGIDKISLTGEVGTGKKVMADAATTLKGVTLELGGKSPIIVFDDADFDSAVNAALVANFYSAGEVCSNGTRVFVQRGMYEEFVSKLAPRAEALKIGDPFDPDVVVGPLISREHHAKVMGYMDIALASGARHLCGGTVPDDPALADGNYVTPAIFADCEDDMQFVKEEVFGPLMAVLPFDDEDEALRRANDTNYGLSGAVFTTDFARAHRVANSIQAGSVWINDYNALPASIPFGGYKQSGVGRENGLVTIDHFTQWKTIYANLTTFDAYY